MSEWPLACYYLVESYMNEKHPRTRALFEAVMKRDSESINERDWEDMPQKDRDVFEAAINEVFPSVAPEVEAKIRNDALEEAAQIALRRTEIPRDARKPTRDQVVIVGEEIATLIRSRKTR